MLKVERPPNHDRAEASFSQGVKLRRLPNSGLSDFMEYFGGNLAREIARLTGWEDKVWSRRYESILITDEESAQVERLTYILSNTVKENLVARVKDWPGVHCARPLLNGEEVEGTWFDRRREYSARLQGKEPEPREFASPEKVVLSQFPCNSLGSARLHYFVSWPTIPLVLFGVIHAWLLRFG